MEYVEFFDSLKDFSDTINSRPTNKPFRGFYKDDSRLASLKTNRTDFCRTPNFMAAEKLMLEGDYENLEKLTAVELPKAIKGDSTYKTQIRKSVCGSLPNVPLYLRGVPTNMLDFRKKKIPGKTINMIVNSGVFYTTPPEDVIRVGALITSVVKKLEERGMRVNLYTSNYFCDEGLKNLVSVIIRIKKAESPLNLLNIAYPLIHPSFTRRHCFRFLETIPVNRLPDAFTNGYGCVATIDQYIQKTSNKKLLSFDKAVKINIQEMCDLLNEEIVSKIYSQLKAV